MTPFIDQLYDAVVNTDTAEVNRLLPLVLQENHPLKIISEVFYPALNEVRSRYRQRQIAIPEVLLSLEIFQKVLTHIAREWDLPLRQERVLIGVIEGDIHDMGKNIVREVYRCYGFDVLDLGKNVPVELFLEKAQAEHPAIIAISTMMSTTIDKVTEVISLAKKKLAKIKIMVGGAFITPEIAISIGADGYAESAVTLIEETEKILAAL